MSDTLTAPDPMAGRIIPREDFDTLTDAQLREKYPKAFEFADNVEKEWAEEKKKENAKKATIREMLGGSVESWERDGVKFSLKPAKFCHQLRMTEIAEKYQKLEETTSNNMRFLLENVGVLMMVRGADGEEAPASLECIAEAFTSDELIAILQLSQGKDPDAGEGEEGANPPTL